MILVWIQSWWSKYQPCFLNESKLGLLMVFSPTENLRSRCHQWNPICYWQAKLFGLTEPNLGFSPNSGWDTSTAPGLSPWCKNSRSWFAIDESCEEGIVSKVEAIDILQIGVFAMWCGLAKTITTPHLIFAVTCAVRCNAVRFKV